MSGLVDRARKAFGVEPPPNFVPSTHLIRAFKRARTLNRNVQRASMFDPRLHRRAWTAAEGVRALAAHEHRTFKEAHA